MKLNETADLYKEIVEKCPQLNGSHFIIMDEHPPSKVSIGYEIVINTQGKKHDEKTKQTLNDIAYSHGLKTAETQNMISMYTPREKEKKAIV